jgi:hypothetical protein
LAGSLLGLTVATDAVVAHPDRQTRNGGTFVVGLSADDPDTPDPSLSRTFRNQRFVRTIRSECLDWLLILNRRHFERILRLYVAHCNREATSCAGARAAADGRAYRMTSAS